MASPSSSFARPAWLLLLGAGLTLPACGGSDPATTSSGAGGGESSGASSVESAGDAGATATTSGSTGSGLGAPPTAPDIAADTDPLTGDVSMLDESVREKILEARGVVELDTGDPLRWRDLGHVYAANVIPSLAVQCYERAIELDGQDARIWYQMALAQHAAGNVSDAMAAAESAIELDGNQSPYHWRRGFWLFDEGLVSEAEAAFQRARQIDATDAAAVVGLARVQLENDQLDEAIEGLSSILASSSDMPFAPYVRRTLATAYRRNGQEERAGALESLGTEGEPMWFDPASIEIARYSAQTIFHLAAEAVFLANSKQFDQAIEKMRLVVADDPTETARRNQLARFMDLAGRSQEAITEYRESLRQSPEDREGAGYTSCEHYRIQNCFAHAHTIHG